MKKWIYSLLAFSFALTIGSTVQAADCWCASDGGACTKVNQVFTSAEQCNNHCRSIGSVSRHFDEGHDYSTPRSPHMCGNYCWCQKFQPPSLVPECESHITSPYIVPGKSFAMIEATECTTLCQALGGTSAGFENEFHQERKQEDCSYQPRVVTRNEVDSFRPPADFGYTSPVGNVSVINIINRLIKFMLGIVGALMLAMLVYGGGLYMTAGSQFGSGDKPGASASQITKAKDTIKNAIIGMAIVVFSYAFVSMILNYGNQALRGVDEITPSGGNVGDEVPDVQAPTPRAPLRGNCDDFDDPANCSNQPGASTDVNANGFSDDFDSLINDIADDGTVKTK